LQPFAQIGVLHVKPNRRASLISRIREYMPDPDDQIMLAAFGLAPVAELERTLAKLRKKTFRAAELKRALQIRVEAEQKAREEAARLPNVLRRKLRSAFESVFHRGSLQ